MFQLTDDEHQVLKSQIITSKQREESLRSQIVTLKQGRGQHSKYLPYAFTRNGIGMLSSVLHSETAVGVNIRIMRAFTAIPQIINQSLQVIERIVNIEHHQQETDEKIDIIFDRIDEISPKQLPDAVFPTQKYQTL